jgi:hypothetical protein
MPTVPRDAGIDQSPFGLDSARDSMSEADRGFDGTVPHCGDGVADPGEECDLGDLNDVRVYWSDDGSWIADPNGIVWCDGSCWLAQGRLCEPCPGIHCIRCE